MNRNTCHLNILYFDTCVCFPYFNLFMFQVFVRSNFKLNLLNVYVGPVKAQTMSIMYKNFYKKPHLKIIIC